ncbi:hypothetical protein [Kocuria aegyptia]|uniref:Ferritin-like domain-containing protein n=1 Tax=Kocuria aegyptia TaxID=330943 RepID=A0ABP4WMJ2_9MICC
MNTTGFDVHAYMRHPLAIRPTDVDVDVMDALSAPALDALTCLWQVERTALGRMRDVLVTPTHAESRVSAFLTTWGYEQHWLAQTLHAVLHTNGRSPQEPFDTRRGRIRRSWDDRARPTVAAIATNLMGAEITGAHMVTGWLDTAVLTVAYRQLGEIEPALKELTEAITRAKERHLGFYAEEVGTRLARSAAARRIARSAVARWHFPGTRYAGGEPARAALFPLFTDPAGRAALEEINRTAAAFPGLSRTRPVHHRCTMDRRPVPRRWLRRVGRRTTRTEARVVRRSMRPARLL